MEIKQWSLVEYLAGFDNFFKNNSKGCIQLLWWYIYVLANGDVVMMIVTVVIVAMITEMLLLK